MSTHSRMRHRNLLAATLASGLSFYGAGCVSTPAETTPAAPVAMDAYAQGVQLAQAGSPREAIDQLDLVPPEHEHYTMALLERARAYHVLWRRAENPDRADARLTAAHATELALSALRQNETNPSPQTTRLEAELELQHAELMLELPGGASLAHEALAGYETTYGPPVLLTKRLAWLRLQIDSQAGRTENAVQHLQAFDDATDLQRIATLIESNYQRLRTQKEAETSGWHAPAETNIALARWVLERTLKSNPEKNTAIKQAELALSKQLLLMDRIDEANRLVDALPPIQIDLQLPDPNEVPEEVLAKQPTDSPEGLKPTPIQPENAPTPELRPEN